MGSLIYRIAFLLFIVIIAALPQTHIFLMRASDNVNEEKTKILEDRLKDISEYFLDSPKIVFVAPREKGGVVGVMNQWSSPFYSYLVPDFGDTLLQISYLNDDFRGRNDSHQLEHLTHSVIENKNNPRKYKKLFAQDQQPVYQIYFYEFTEQTAFGDKPVQAIGLTWFEDLDTWYAAEISRPSLRITKGELKKMQALQKKLMVDRG